MRLLILPILLGLCSAAIAAPLEPVALENGVSPTKRYEVVLEADKDSPSFKRYEMKGDASQFPRFLIREISSGKTVGSLPWTGDPGSDEQPLRKHCEIIWRGDGGAVAINTHERFYSYTSVFVLDPKSGKFTEVLFPDYKTLTGFPEPNVDQLKPCGRDRVLGWTQKGDLVYGISLTPLASYKGNDPLNHRIELRVSPKGMKVIRRDADPKDDGPPK